MNLKSFLIGASATALLTSGALARNFDIAGGNLDAALSAYQVQSGVTLMVPSDSVRDAQTSGVKGDIAPEQALILLLKGTGFGFSKDSSGVIAIVPKGRSSSDNSDIRVQHMRLAQAAPSRAAVETVTVTSSKLGGADVQSIPIAITALSQEQLTATQTAGGPDLVKQVPNLTFTKTNFTGYSIQIRGIGTQAISVTTDPAVAVAMNDIPFIRNHFFEQEFYDVGQVEVLRGPQGTLYGRNATAGVVNLIPAMPTDQFEAVASGEIGSYHQRRLEGMINIPIVDDRVDLRVAGEWTKRQGYSFNALTDERIDGRDLWSGRITLAFNPTKEIKTSLIWEHFSEDDDRMRTSKQLCKTATPPTTVLGTPVPPPTLDILGISGLSTLIANYLSQSCAPTSLYSPDAFEVPYGFSLPYAIALAAAGGGINPGIDPYASTTQSRNLRVIESALNPTYQAKNDVLELNATYAVSPSLTLTSQTGYNQDFLSSTEDYNRFNTSPGIFSCTGYCGSSSPLNAYYFRPDPSAGTGGIPDTAALFCDPQLGCSDRIVAEDLSNEHAWQFSQELRLNSNLGGPLNFSVGGNYLHYETEENYYVFINALTDYAAQSGDHFGDQSTIDHSDCIQKEHYQGGYQNPDPTQAQTPTQVCIYIDPNPISSLNNYGHNYFLSQNPYTLNSYAAFGEVNYKVLDELQVTGGLRWTEDRKHFTDIPSEVVSQGYGYTVTGIVDQQWDKFTGRAVLNWTPKLDFTDQTLIYGSFARGYKAGGANPPGAVLIKFERGDVSQPVHPLTFRPEYINAFEFGTKNTLLDGALTLNGDVFYYDYKDYQISEIVDRTSINLNFNATVKGAEIESTWEPMPGLRFNFAGGYENTRIGNGQSAVDLMDRTDSANHPDWMVVKPFPTQASNCIFPDYVIQALLQQQAAGATQAAFSCGSAYASHLDPVTLLPYVANPLIGGIPSGCTSCTPVSVPNGYIGFDPTNPAINNGAGFAKKVDGNELPNAPPFTVSFGAQYSIPLSSDWASTLRADYYWQDYSWARVFNDNPYDRIRGYTNVNLALILTSQEGWQVMLYDKNVFNETAITGDFLNSDDSGLTTNVFLTDPKLIGIRVTKNW